MQTCNNLFHYAILLMHQCVCLIQQLILLMQCCASLMQALANGTSMTFFEIIIAVYKNIYATA